MAEYIDRRKAELGVQGLTIVDPAVSAYAEAVLFILRNAPAADVEPVVHGHWVSTIPPLGAGDVALRCSVCGRVCHEKDAPYCYCGAKMHGGVQ